MLVIVSLVPRLLPRFLLQCSMRQKAGEEPGNEAWLLLQLPAMLATTGYGGLKRQLARYTQGLCYLITRLA